MTRCGLEVRRTSALLLLSTLAAALCAGCLNAGPEVQSVEASAGAASGGPAETSKENMSGAGGMPKTTTIGASQIEGDLAGATDASSGIPFVAKTQASGGSGYDADTVLAVRYEVNEDYERAVIDLGTGLEPAGPVPEWSLVSQEGNGLLRVTLPAASATCVSDGEFGDGLLESFLVVPRPRVSISDPLTVNGYSRNPEAANTISLIDSDGNILVRRVVLSNDRGHHTWGYFEATL